MARNKLGRRYSAEQKQEVIRRVQAGETQAAVAKATGISAWTVGQWVRRAKGGAKVGRKAGRPRGTRSARRLAGRTGRRSENIVWALDGDVLVVRIPMRQFALQLAREALAGI